MLSNSKLPHAGTLITLMPLENENGNVGPKGVHTFLGKVFTHNTSKGGYQDISTEWNRLYPNNKKEFHGKIKNLNAILDEGALPAIAEKV